jgi:hypothetical protein
MHRHTSNYSDSAVRGVLASRKMSEKKDKGKDPEDGVSRSKSRSDSKSKVTAEEKKQALEEVEDELSESDEEDDATPADKAGYIEIGKKKDKFKTVYAILSGGSLFYYKDIRVRSLVQRSEHFFE